MMNEYFCYECGKDLKPETWESHKLLHLAQLRVLDGEEMLRLIDDMKRSLREQSDQNKQVLALLSEILDILKKQQSLLTDIYDELVGLIRHIA